LFQWLAPVADISSNNPGTAAVTRTLASVPTGVNVIAHMQALLQNTGAGTATGFYLSDLATTDTAVVISGTVFSDTPNALTGAGSVQLVAARAYVRTNTSAQIRSRVGGFSDANVTLVIYSLGWTDTRGRNG
jgi:hypothetical protein